MMLPLLAGAHQAAHRGAGGRVDRGDAGRSGVQRRRRAADRVALLRPRRSVRRSRRSSRSRRRRSSWSRSTHAMPVSDCGLLLACAAHVDSAVDRLEEDCARPAERAGRVAGGWRRTGDRVQRRRRAARLRGPRRSAVGRGDDRAGGADGDARAGGETRDTGQAVRRSARGGGPRCAVTGVAHRARRLRPRRTSSRSGRTRR